MNHKEYITRIIQSDWHDSPEGEICLVILNYVYDGASDYTHISYGSIKQLVGDKYSDELTLIAIQYLCGSRVKVLDRKFEYIEEEDIYELTDEEIIEIRRTGIFIHPDKGEPVSNYSENIFMYFVPSENLKELYAG